MKTLSSSRARLALVSLAMTVLTNAAGAAPDSHPCATIAADDERLACYDKAFGSAEAPPKGAPAKPDFGLPAKKAYPTEAEKKEAEIRAIISTVERRRDGKFLVKLDNGQTWLQSENDSRVDVKVGDTVNVRRAALGSYLLSNRDGLATRVKRVN